MKIGMVGMGFVGGTTAMVLGTAHEILSYDKYKEPYTTSECIEKLVKHSEVVFICVPTPMKLSGEIDYGPMHDSFRLMTSTASKVGRDPKDLLVTVRSTAVSGTTDSFAKKYDFPIAFNPEFLREKRALEDMLATGRIVLGVADEQSEMRLRAVYKPVFPNAEIIVTDRKTAEMVKYAANATLAAQIMIANDLYKICEVLGINYSEMIKIVQKDERIGRNMKVPGHDGKLGFGGKCLPKDLSSLIRLAEEHYVEPNLLREVRRSNLDVREDQDWFGIPGAVSGNNSFES